MPAQADGSGVDAVVATISAGPSVKTVIVGLLNEVSLQSARRLAESTYSRVVESLDLSDQRKPEQQLDSIVRSRPDLVILTGGTDGGASRSILKMLEAVGLACYLMPMEKRPMVLYAIRIWLVKYRNCWAGMPVNWRSVSMCAHLWKQKTWDPQAASLPGW
jgi:hypothetical protein